MHPPEPSCKLPHSRALIRSKAKLCKAAKPSPAADAAELCTSACLSSAARSIKSRAKIVYLVLCFLAKLSSDIFRASPCNLIHRSSKTAELSFASGQSFSLLESLVLWFLKLEMAACVA